MENEKTCYIVRVYDASEYNKVIFCKVFLSESLAHMEKNTQEFIYSDNIKIGVELITTKIELNYNWRIK